MSDNANKGGRKRIPIDQKVFENLCSIQCTLAEIAAVIGCSEDTIERWCVRTYKEGFAETYKKEPEGQSKPAKTPVQTCRDESDNGYLVRQAVVRTA